MTTGYLNEPARRAKYKFLLEYGPHYGWIKELPGVWLLLRTLENTGGIEVGCRGLANLGLKIKA